MSFLFSGFDPSMYEAYVRKARTLVVFLQQHRIRLAHDSRVMVYIRQLEEGPGRNVSVRHRALLELDDLRLVVDALACPEPLRGWQDRVQALVAGHALPQDDTQATARNLQFELVLASLLRRAGYEVELREPDVIATSPELSFAFAAKRPKSRKKLPQNIRDANRQIRHQVNSSSLCGVVALDLSQLLNPQNGYLSSESFSEASTKVHIELHDFVRKHAAAFRRSVDPQTTIAIATYFPCLVLDCSRGTLGYVRAWSFANMCDHNDPRFEILRRLGERVGIASYLQAG